MQCNTWGSWGEKAVLLIRGLMKQLEIYILNHFYEEGYILFQCEVCPASSDCMPHWA